MCGATRPKTTLDFGHITKKVTKFHHPGCCASARDDAAPVFGGGVDPDIMIEAGWLIEW